MLDLSDWAWLIIVGIYFVVRTVSRLFRSRSPVTADKVPPKPERMPSDGRLEPPPEPAPDRFEGRGGERLTEIGPKPIEPR